MRFDGNSILIADPDMVYARQLAESLTFHGAKCSVGQNMASAKAFLQSHDFDLIICNYYLPDGIIHELIDWCSQNLRILPIFTCLGHPFPGDFKITHKHSIVDIFSKSDSRRIFAGISKLLFDFKHFHDSLLEILAPEEIILQVKVNDAIYSAHPIEVSPESLLLHLETEVSSGTFGLLKYSLGEEQKKQNFTLPGFFEGRQQNAELFRINKSYLCNWAEFLNHLESKQVNISHFMKKVSGI